MRCEHAEHMAAAERAYQLQRWRHARAALGDARSLLWRSDQQQTDKDMADCDIQQAQADEHSFQPEAAVGHQALLDIGPAPTQQSPLRDEAWIPSATMPLEKGCSQPAGQASDQGIPRDTVDDLVRWLVFLDPC